MQFTRKLASQLLVEAIDWQPSGVMTRNFAEPDHWHSDAGWIKPAALVKACLSQPNVIWRGDCEVKRLMRDESDGKLWKLLDANDQVIAQTQMLVIAASNQSAGLINTLPINTLPNTPTLNFQAVRGQVSYGDLKAATTIPHPINGGGSYIETDTQWLIGATYDRDNLSLEPSIRDQVDNFE
ncbi:MAG: hypothetical protein RL535_196, partial [Pseudomonadota bacterium]